jgi:hypothetical protein
MGNNNIKPARHATASYAKFLEPLAPEAKGNNTKDFIKYMDREFNLFLEDFLLNDEQFQSFKENPEDRRTCIATILLTHTAFGFAMTTEKIGWNPSGFCDEWHEGTPAKNAVHELVALEYIYASGKFYKWNESTWEVCEESDLVVPTPKPNFNFTIGKVDFTSDEVEAARQWAQEKVNECKEALDNLDLSEVVTIVKDRNTKTNASKTKLPCKTNTVNLAKFTAGANKRSNFFTVSLPYDAVKETTEVVKSFVSAFGCSSKDLATNVLRLGSRTTPLITIIVGPPSSGKTTLCKVLQSLYGPFATSSDADKTGSVNYDLVRTCFFDGVNLLSEHCVAAHDCHNLVFTCTENPLLGDSYGGREVYTLVLDSPIDNEASNVDIVSKVTTLKQLGSLLGWCLQHGASPANDSDMQDVFMKMLMSSMSGPGVCGQSGCKNCSKGPSESTPEPSSVNSPEPTPETKTKESDESDDEPSESTKVFRLGADGLTQVAK